MKTLGLAAAAAAALLAAPVAASATTTLDFGGFCLLGCFSGASGQLTLSSSYVFGTPLDSADFVSFTYDSPDMDFTITNAELTSISGSIESNGRVDFPFLNISSSADSFTESYLLFLPVFLATDSDSRIGLNGGIGGFGSSASTPEPATWALLLTGFAGLGAAIRARRGKPATA